MGKPGPPWLPLVSLSTVLCARCIRYVILSCVAEDCLGTRRLRWAMTKSPSQKLSSYKRACHGCETCLFIGVHQLVILLLMLEMAGDEMDVGCDGHAVTVFRDKKLH